MGKESPFNRLTLFQRSFLKLYFGPCEFNATEAYSQLKEGTVPRDRCMQRGRQLLYTIRKKVSWEEVLEFWDLDDNRLGMMVDKMLKAQKTIFWQGEPVADVQDNVVQHKATELLADLRGKRKQVIETTPTGGGVIVYIPDNERDDGD